MSYIPHRSNQKAVDKFAGCIATICANYPSAVLFDDNHYHNIRDFKDNLRNAVRGVSKYHFTNPLFSREEVLSWCETYTTRIISDKVCVGGRSEVMSYNTGTKTLGLAVDADIKLEEVIIDEGNIKILEAIILLQDEGYLTDVKLDVCHTDTIRHIIDKNPDCLVDFHVTDTHIHLL